MSFEAAAWAIKQTTSTATDKLVLIALADCFNKNNSRCDPSNQYLAIAAQCDIRYVSESTQRLEADGFIRIQHRTGRRNNYALHKYHLDTNGPDATPLDKTPEQTAGVLKTDPRAQFSGPLNSVTKTPELSSPKPVITNKNQKPDFYKTENQNPRGTTDTTKLADKPIQAIAQLEKLIDQMPAGHPSAIALNEQIEKLRASDG